MADLVQGVAVLEFPEFYEEVGNLIDHHRDMRLDIEDMSYEVSWSTLFLFCTAWFWLYFYWPLTGKFAKWPQELLALGERIGNVNTGLPEEAITSKLKTRTYSTFAININLEEAAPIDQETDSCIICQVILSA